MKKKCLFLGYNSKQTRLIDKIKFFKEVKWDVVHSNKKLNFSKAKKYNLIITFGYRHIIAREILIKLKKPIINLHIGFLPYNRGSHPNFWSFVENTPSGVTIHKIDGGLDTGNIIYQKLIDFQILKNKKKLTFADTHKRLIMEIENLFIKNIREILSGKFKTYKQVGKGSYHSSRDLPKILKSWRQNIFKTVSKFNNIKEKKLSKRLMVLNKIQKTRKNNNVNWMNIVRVALKNSPEEASGILNKINIDDKKITNLFKELAKH